MERTSIQTVKLVEDLLKRMYQEPSLEPRVAIFHEVEPLLEQLDVEARTWPNCSYCLEKLLELRCHLAAVAGLNDKGGHPAKQHYIWSLSAINALAGPHCFGRETAAGSSGATADPHVEP